MEYNHPYSRYLDAADQPLLPQANPEDQQMGFHTSNPHQRAGFVPPWTPYASTNNCHFPQQVGLPSEQVNFAPSSQVLLHTDFH